VQSKDDRANVATNTPSACTTVGTANFAGIRKESSMKWTSLLVLGLTFLCTTFLFAGGQTESTATAPKGPVLVRILSPGNAVPGQEQIMTDVEKQTGIKVQWMYVAWGDYKNKLQVLLSAGDPYEMNLDADWLGFDQRASRGAFLDITKMVQTQTPDLYKKFNSADWAAVSMNGKIYGVPWLYPKTDRRAPNVREDLRMQYNLPAPTDMKNFELYLKTIKEKTSIMPFTYSSDGAVTDFASDYGWATFLDQSLGIYYKVGDKSLKLFPVEQTQGYRQIVERAHSWYLNGWVPSDPITARNNKTFDLAKGTVAATYFLNENNEEKTKQLDTLVPGAIIKTYPNTSVLYSRVAASNNMYAFNANGQHPEAALKLLQWIHSSQENYDLFMLGVKGRNWDLTADGHVQILPSIAKSTYYNWQSPWPLWDINYMRPLIGESLNKYQEVKAYAYENTVPDPSAGFVPDLSKIKTAIAERSALRSEIGIALEYGISDPSGIDAYIQKQKANAKVIIDELQGQLDKWLAGQKQ